MKVSKDAWPIIIGVAAAIAIVTIVMILIPPWAEACIREKPVRVVRGAVQSEAGGAFSNWFEVYYVWDAGALEESGEACEKRRRVTEGEYERLIYGAKP